MSGNVKIVSLFRHWRERITRELLRDDDVLVYHREGDAPARPAEPFDSAFPRQSA
jgi:hypothetical protein